MKRLLLKLVGGLLETVLLEVLEQLVNEAQEKISELGQLTAREREVADMALTVLEDRAGVLLKEKLASL